MTPTLATLLGGGVVVMFLGGGAGVALAQPQAPGEDGGAPPPAPSSVAPSAPSTADAGPPEPAASAVATSEPAPPPPAYPEPPSAAPAPPASTAPSAPSEASHHIEAGPTPEGGLVLAQGSGGIPRLSLSGVLQVDWVLHRQTSQDQLDPSTGLPLNDDRVFIRRAQPRLFAETRYVTGALSLDASTTDGARVRPLEAEVTARLPGPDGAPPYLALGAGVFQTPFGFETPERFRRRAFLEKSTAGTALFAGSFDAGVRVHGGYRLLRYSVAFMNGSPVGSGDFELRDPTKGKDLVARVGMEGDLGAVVHALLGVSLSSGTGLHKGTPSTKDVLVWRDENENGIVDVPEIRVVPGIAATPSRTFERFVMGAHARAAVKIGDVGALTLWGEIYRGKNMDRGVEPSDPIVVGRELRQLGWYAAVTQGITPFALVGVRYDRYDPDADASEQRAIALVPVDRTYATWSFMATGYYPPARLIAQYDLRRNALGRAPSGAPTTLSDDAFTLRAEVAF